jgi:hypothetical protein
MRRTVLAIALGFGMVGCMSGGPIDSNGNPIVEGDWVLAPDVSATPILAEAVPEGVVATPVDLVLRGDGQILVVCDELPTSGIVDDGDDGGGDRPGVLRGDVRNAPAQPVGNRADEANVDTGPPPADALGGGMLERQTSVNTTDIDRLRPLPDSVYIFHAGCL